jgi:ribosomal protein S18 acetylase RimI-like enzyme
VPDVSDAAMLEAMEDNMNEEVGCFGRGLPGAELYQDAELSWFITGRPHLNGVLRTRLRQEDADYVNAVIARTQQHFLERNVAINWPLGPLTRPSNLDAYLLTHGFALRHEDIGMAINVQAVQEQKSTPPTFFTREVEDRKALKQWLSVAMQSFGTSWEGAQTYYKNYVRLGFGAGMPWRHYIGYLQDKPVAVASLLLHAGIAGIYGVATIPGARRKGAGTAITRHALREASRQGYHVAVLAPSEMGLEMYRHIGFQKYCQIRHYLWQPAQ